MSNDSAPAPPTGFTPEEDLIHVEGFQRIRDGLAAGLGFDEACARLKVADAELRRIIVDDYLKVAIAAQHFEEGRDTAEVAAALRIPVERVDRARQEMLGAVAAASVEVFRRQGGGFPPEEKN